MKQISRRTALKQGVAVGTAAWVAPMIVSSKAHAAGSLSDDACGTGRPRALQCVYTVGPWAWDVCHDPTKNPPTMPDQRSPRSEPLTWHEKQCVDIEINKPSGNVLHTGVVPGTPIPIDSIGNKNPNITIRFRPHGTHTWVASMLVHVSCSQPLCIGDRHGYLDLTGFTPK